MCSDSDVRKSNLPGQPDFNDKTRRSSHPKKIPYPPLNPLILALCNLSSMLKWVHMRTVLSFTLNSLKKTLDTSIKYPPP